MLARSGEITDPCPVPLSLTVTTPSSRTPALSHFWIRRMMRRSPTRCSTNLMSHSWLTVSKNERMSASSIQFTFVLVIPTKSASIASCVPRPDRNPYENPRKSSYVDRAQHRSRGPLDDLVLKGGDRDRALPTIRLGYINAP